MSAVRTVCLLGFGEVGQTLAAQLRAHAVSLVAWDLAFADVSSAPRRAAPRFGVQVAENPRAAAADADLVISAVTAAQTFEAARSLQPHLQPGAWYFDLNSTSPGAKRRTAESIDRAGARYVEAAIMSPIAPAGAGSPMLLGGAHAAAFLPVARALGFTGVQLMDGPLGRASAAKMCRSVVVKGLEALLLESLLAARRHGVEQEVLQSLRGMRIEDWRVTGSYMISRTLVHGRRRAEEMFEAARTVQEAGIDARMSHATVAWQDWAGRRGAPASPEDLDTMLDRLLDGAGETLA